MRTSRRFRARTTSARGCAALPSPRAWASGSGITFGLAFVTGVISHWAQTPSPWLAFPTSPSWGYRVTQGVHVIAGTAAVPLLLVKLWTVFPKLLARPPREVGRAGRCTGSSGCRSRCWSRRRSSSSPPGSPTRPSGTPGTSTSGPTHYAVGWIAIGALVVHIAVKLPIIRTALTSDVDSTAQDRPGMAAGPGVMSRRGLLRTTWAAAGVAVLATAGATVPWLRRVSVLGRPVRRRDPGVSRSTTPRPARRGRGRHQRDVPAGRGDGDREMSFTLADLRAMPQTTASLPIACVEGWSAGATWTGVPVRRPPRPVRRTCRERGAGGVAAGARRGAGTARWRRNFSDHPHTLLALDLERRAALDRPRLPVPADRARPSRCRADQVGRPARGDVVMRASRLALLLARPRAPARTAWCGCSTSAGRTPGRRWSGWSAASCCTTRSSRRWCSWWPWSRSGVLPPGPARSLGSWRWWSSCR